jgi:hypothetical protein
VIVGRRKNAGHRQDGLRLLMLHRSPGDRDGG